MTASPATRIFPPENQSRVEGLFSSPAKRTFILSLALFLLTLIVYYLIRNNSFINFDDNQYILANAHVKSGLNWETLKWAFTTFDAANWHPLTWLSHALDCELFGLNAAGHHFVSLLLHAVNVVLLFLLLEGLTRRPWPSLVVAALFAVHPLNIESVAWAAERKSVLSMLFFLCALLAYSSYVGKPSWVRYSSVAGLFALALMSKPQVITLPFVLLLLDYWPLRRTQLLPATSTGESHAVVPRALSRLVAEKIPLLLLAGGSAFLTLYAQKAGNAVRTTVEYSLCSRIENALTSYVWYVRDVFLPLHLAPIYPHPAGLLSTWKVLVAGFVLLGFSFAFIVARKRTPYLLFGWLWFLGTLVPMIGIVQVGEQARADRYMYIAIIGLLVAAVWGFNDLLTRFKMSSALNSVLWSAVLIVLSIATSRQVSFWRNSETLWNYTLSVTHNNFMAEDNLAQELAHQGRTQEALVHFQHILGLRNWQPSDLIAFGLYEQRQGYAADAIKQYQRAFANASGPATRAAALTDMGSAYLDLRDRSAAKLNFEAALQIDPNDVPALIGTGVIAETEGNLKLAGEQFTKAVKTSPSDLGYELLARTLEQQGNASEAALDHKKARQLSPNFDATQSLAQHLLTP